MCPLMRFLSKGMGYRRRYRDICIPSWLVCKLPDDRHCTVIHQNPEKSLWLKTDRGSGGIRDEISEHRHRLFVGQCRTGNNAKVSKGDCAAGLVAGSGGPSSHTTMDRKRLMARTPPPSAPAAVCARFCICFANVSAQSICNLTGHPFFDWH